MVLTAEAVDASRFLGQYSSHLFYRYSGEVFGISNMFATVPGIIAPPSVNALTPTVSTALSQED